MLDITDAHAFARALDSPIDPVVKELLTQRRDQLLSDTGREYDLSELAQFIVVDPHDAIATIEGATGFPVITAPAFEWVADHGGWYEAVTIVSDDGFGIVLLIPNDEDVAPELLLLLRQAAQEHPVAP